MKDFRTDAPAIGASALAQMAVGARVGVGGRIGLGKEFLDCGQHSCLNFDEVVQFLAILGGHSINGSAVVSRMSLAVSLGSGLAASMLLAYQTNGLSGEFSCSSFGKLLSFKFRSEFCRILIFSEFTANQTRTTFRCSIFIFLLDRNQ